MSIVLAISGKDESNKPLIQIVSEFVKNQEIKTKYTNILELEIAIALGLTRILKGELFLESNNQKTGHLKIEFPLYNPNN